MGQPHFPNKYKLLLKVFRALQGNGLDGFKGDSFLLQQLWYEYKLGFMNILKKVEMEDFLKIDECTFAFHLNENYQFSYDPTSNCLELNILSFFFHINPEEDRIFFDMDYKMTSSLVHEIDHYFYSKEHGVIGWSEEERDDFDKEHLAILEMQAYRRQIIFLERYREICAEKIVLFEITPEIKVKYLIENLDGYLRDSLIFLEDMVKFVEDNPEDYNNFGTEQSNRILNRMGELFDIPFEQTKNPINKILLNF